jgi:hypothetical protein
MCASEAAVRSGSRQNGSIHGWSDTRGAPSCKQTPQYAATPTRPEQLKRGVGRGSLQALRTQGTSARPMRARLVGTVPTRPTDCQVSVKNSGEQTLERSPDRTEETEPNSFDEEDLDSWLGGRDSNPDNVVQSHVSYRWTTSQCQLTRSESARTIDYSQSKTGPASASPAPEHRAIRERASERARRKTCTTTRRINLDPLTATNRSIRPSARSAHSRPSTTRFPNPAACGDGSPSRPFARLRGLPRWSTRAPSPSDAQPYHPYWRCRVACFYPSKQNHDPLLPPDPPTQAGYERCPGPHLIGCRLVA